MSSSSVISKITTEIRRQLFDTFTASPDHDLGLTSVEGISTSVPSKGLDQNAVASLYLYRVAVDEHLRNQRPLPGRTEQDLLRRPPIPLRLHYRFTPVSEDEEVNQILVGPLLQHLHDFPTFTTTLSDVPIGDSHAGASLTLPRRTARAPRRRLAVPDRPYTFGQVIAVQTAGNPAVSRDKGLPTFRREVRVIRSTRLFGSPERELMREVEQCSTR